MSSSANVNLDPTARFGNRASEYAAARPSYPADAIDAIVAGLAESCDVAPAQLVVADVGAGTGISSRLLAARGVRVVAVEPNEPMRKAGENDRTTGIEWCGGMAEATGLADQSVHAVVCAQAFHWFRAEEALREFSRIIAPGGRVALMWNNRDQRDSFTDEYTRTLSRAAEASGYAEPRMGIAEPLQHSPLFANYRVLESAYVQRLDEQGLLKRAASVSYVPKSGPAHDQLVAELRAAFARHAGSAGYVALTYITRVHLADKRA